MRDELFNLPAPRLPASCFAAQAGRLARGVLWPVAIVLLLACRVLLLVLLHLLRPFIVWPLLLATASGMGVAACFAAAAMWHDAARAGLATLAAAAVLGLYSRLVLLLDPEHHDRVPLRHRGFCGF